VITSNTEKETMGESKEDESIEVNDFAIDLENVD